MHIVSFISGATCASAIVVAIAYAAGFSGWAAIGMGAASFGLAQVLYIVWLAAMARTEARRRGSDASGSDAAPAKPSHGVVQKS